MFELKNHMETVVYKALQDYLSRESLSCSCQRCQTDIMALALNRLPARYFVSNQGEIFTVCESYGIPSQAKILAEIITASKQVGNAPSHSLPITNET